MAFSTVSVYSLVSSLIYEFSFILRLCVEFWKKEFISSETGLSLEIILSYLSASVTLLDIFRFSEDKKLKIFPKGFTVNYV